MLGTHAARVEAVRNAELDYRGVVMIESLRHEGRATRASATRVDKALSALAEAVIDLQESHGAVVSLAENENVTPERLRALDETFDVSDRELASYLAARTCGQVREAASRPRSAQAASSPAIISPALRNSSAQT